MKDILKLVRLSLLLLTVVTVLSCTNTEKTTLVLKGDFPQLGKATVRVYAYDRRTADREAVLLSIGDYPVTDNPMKISIPLTREMKEKAAHIDKRYIRYYIVPMISTASEEFMADFASEGIPEMTPGGSVVVNMINLD